MNTTIETGTETIERAVNEQVKVVKAAVRELQRVLIEVSLTEAYEKRVAPLTAESDRLENEISVLRKSHDELKPRLAARRRLSERQIDECLANGDDAGATAKREEINDEEKALNNLAGKIDEYVGKCQKISAKKLRIAKEIFEQTYPLLPVATFALIAETVDLLDSLKAGLFQYAESTGIQGTFPYTLIRQYHLDNLTPTDMPGSDRALSSRVDAWFK